MRRERLLGALALVLSIGVLGACVSDPPTVVPSDAGNATTPDAQMPDADGPDGDAGPANAGAPNNEVRPDWTLVVNEGRTVYRWRPFTLQIVDMEGDAVECTDDLTVTTDSPNQIEQTENGWVLLVNETTTLTASCNGSTAPSVMVTPIDVPVEPAHHYVADFGATPTQATAWQDVASDFDLGGPMDRRPTLQPNGYGEGLPRMAFDGSVLNFGGDSVGGNQGLTFAWFGDHSGDVKEIVFARCAGGNEQIAFSPSGMELISNGDDSSGTFPTLGNEAATTAWVVSSRFNRPAMGDPMIQVLASSAESGEPTDLQWAPQDQQLWQFDSIGGRCPMDGEKLMGGFSEIIVFDRALDPEEIGDVQSYLTEKHADSAVQ